MKRRHFLASLAALSIPISEALAAPTKPKPGTKPTSSKPATNTRSSSAKPPRGGRNVTSSTTNRRGTRAAAVPAAPAGPTVHTADAPIIEKPPQGTTAAKLPPVKAPEPPAEWRTYEITTRIDLRTSGQTRLWLPLPLNQDTLYQRTLGHSWEGNPSNSTMRRLPDGDLEVFHCHWDEGRSGSLTLKTLVTTADRHFDITKRTVAPEREDILRRNLQETKLIPNDGLAFQLGERIVGRIKDPVAQAKAIYDWVIDNTTYDPSLPGCGTGDVRKQLVSGQYGGRSADINGLFVSICRAVGIPARCVYGLRTGSSRLFRSLGLSGDDATRGHHVRAEFYIPGYGWIPLDPSDVRKVIAMEAISERDSKLLALRRVLFGVWEMNWIAFNVGSDITLPGQQIPQAFLLHPQLENGGSRNDGPNAAATQYSISSRRVEL
ncbi:transglutaminase-like domain-containing protein [Dechloromonas sp.]|uniref:transglutaminase-like domain-containing protein n=1 Tax=Dechloromonas sp. TaxID=1917218 RepID=UPI00120DB942|nr:transglutaminase domain-containing protein [Dechloromonas sp.]MBU3698087.1 transglutaminase domain-containing protein [Dechloromonas sp.]TEX50088.1 MAG: transglutaminase [Rhodocyclaceae bacterium]